jgi:hypothetical protein
MAMVWRFVSAFVRENDSTDTTAPLTMPAMTVRGVDTVESERAATTRKARYFRGESARRLTGLGRLLYPCEGLLECPDYQHILVGQHRTRVEQQGAVLHPAQDGGRVAAQLGA